MSTDYWERQMYGRTGKPPVAPDPSPKRRGKDEGRTFSAHCRDIEPHDIHMVRTETGTLIICDGRPVPAMRMRSRGRDLSRWRRVARWRQRRARRRIDKTTPVERRNMPAIVWTKEDSDQATAEGWDLFDSRGSAHGTPTLQRIDCPENGAPALESDPAAWAHVRDHASPLHDKAMAILRTENIAEYIRVLATAGAS